MIYLSDYEPHLNLNQLQLNTFLINQLINLYIFQDSIALAVQAIPSVEKVDLELRDSSQSR